MDYYTTDSETVFVSQKAMPDLIRSEIPIQYSAISRTNWKGLHVKSANVPLTEILRAPDAKISISLVRFKLLNSAQLSLLHYLWSKSLQRYLTYAPQNPDVVGSVLSILC